MAKNPHRAYTLYAQIGADTPKEMQQAAAGRFGRVIVEAMHREER